MQQQSEIAARPAECSTTAVTPPRVSARQRLSKLERRLPLGPDRGARDGTDALRVLTTSIEPARKRLNRTLPGEWLSTSSLHHSHFAVGGASCGRARR